MRPSPKPHVTSWSPLLRVDREARAALASPVRPPADAAPADAAPADAAPASTSPASSILTHGTATPFAGLADSLAHDLHVLQDRDAPIPMQKARLTRIGGRCPTHGTLLEFDPFQPHDHWCARCAHTYHAQEHDDWWAMNAQLWTAERAVHAATLHALVGDDHYAMLAASILRRYVDQYDQWPNADNVLGPSRPFFSTYLESIWLLNLCHAVALLEGTTPAWTDQDASRLRDRVIEPSARLINGFYEGRSNRQVWNEVAICSAWTLLGQKDAARQRLCSAQGIVGLIDDGLDANGFWYEGENYHLFAHRGLWYGVELLRALGEPLRPDSNARYSAGFVAPFLGLLPDETFPSRRDAQYGSSIRQWRTAEWCELGWAHAHDPRSAALLDALYTSRTPRRDTGRSRSTADAERNTTPTSLTRADLSWRALLMADAHVPREAGQALSSVCLPSQGLAIVRRDGGSTYVALEGGKSGGGHGHPDQLALTLQTADARWLEDPGTGSYVEPRLAWYRSTFAHYAPLFDRLSQSAAEAQLVAFEDRESFGWIVKRVEDVIAGVSVERAVLVADGYLIDVLEWEASREVELTLPIAGVAASISAPDAQPAGPDGAAQAPESGAPPAGDPRNQFADREDRGFGFLQDVTRLGTGHQFALVAAPTFARASNGVNARSEADHLRLGAKALAADGQPVAAIAQARLWYATSHTATLHRAVAPAAPGQGEVERHWLTTRASRGRVIGVWSWPTPSQHDGMIVSVALSARKECSAHITLQNGALCTHRLAHRKWRIETLGARDGADVVFDLAQASQQRPGRERVAMDNGVKAMARRVEAHPVLRVPTVLALNAERPSGEPIDGALALDLGERHYVPTERPWRDAGCPTARLQMMTTVTRFIVDVDVHTGPPRSSANVQENPLDNELHDVNADGIQWYLGRNSPPSTPDGEWAAAGLAIPVVDPSGGATVRQTPLITDLLPTVVARITARGWAMRLQWNRMDLPINSRNELFFDLVVNERPPERERRRGQLVLSGGGGYGYLAGSRRPASCGLRLVFDDAR